MTSAIDRLSASEREQLQQSSQPKWTAPMLARLTDRRFSDPRWLFERKLDGERALAFRDGQAVRLLSRNRKDIGDPYPELVEALADQRCADFIADGEIVAFAGSVTSFARLQHRMQIEDPDEARASGIAVYYYLFDLLHLDGYQLDRLPLRTRKKLLKQAIAFHDPLRFTTHRNEEGETFYQHACESGWMASRAGHRRLPTRCARPA